MHFSCYPEHYFHSNTLCCSQLFFLCWLRKNSKMNWRHNNPFSNSISFLYVSSGKRDEVVIRVQKERGAGDKWWFNQQGAQDEMLLTLHSPANAVIGQYQLAVLMMSPDGRIVEMADKMTFHLLFNPWCKGEHEVNCIHSLPAAFSKRSDELHSHTAAFKFSHHGLQECVLIWLLSRNNKQNKLDVGFVPSSSHLSGALRTKI